jgi:hypothetical protein
VALQGCVHRDDAIESADLSLHTLAVYVLYRTVKLVRCTLHATLCCDAANSDSPLPHGLHGRSNVAGKTRDHCRRPGRRRDGSVEHSTVIASDDSLQHSLQR